MKFPALSSLSIIAIFSTTVHAGCYTGGEVGDAANADANIQFVCNVLGG